MDLEFVQMLGNVDYLLWLSTEGYLSDERFINYLKYLLYFVDDGQYIHLFLYPLGLDMLKLLQEVQFREKIIQKPTIFRSVILEQIWSSWAYPREIIRNSKRIEAKDS